jgi:hypothetical protein
MVIRYRWIFWNVIFPLVLPIISSGIVVLMWTTGKSDFTADPGVILDISPWALIFFGLALIGSTIFEFWPRLPHHPGIGLSLLLSTVALAIYAGMMVIWRHEDTFRPAASVYYASGALLIFATALCYLAHDKIEKAKDAQKSEPKTHG